MPKNTQGGSAAIGFRVKSGWAMAVLVGGSIESPQVHDRRVVDLCDPSVPESRQPYHAARGTLETDEAKLRRRHQIVRQAAHRAVPQLSEDCRAAGHRLRAVGLVVGSEIDPDTITNPHIRAHALEGRLFRTMVEEAVRSCRLPCLVIAERNVYARAAEVFGTSEEALKRALARLGRSLGGQWRADEKTASLAAWLALAGRQR
jgi:hypothetical protein